MPGDHRSSDVPRSLQAASSRCSTCRGAGTLPTPLGWSRASPRGSRGQGSRARTIWIARSSGWLLFSFLPSNCSPTNPSVTVPRGGGGEGGDGGWEVGTAGTGRIGAVPQGRSLSGVGSSPGVHGVKLGTAWSPWAAPLWGRPLCAAGDAPDLIPVKPGSIPPPAGPWARSRRDFSSFHLPEDLGARKLSAPSPWGSLPAPLGKARSVPKASPPFLGQGTSWCRAPPGSLGHVLGFPWGFGP